MRSAEQERYEVRRAELTILPTDELQSIYNKILDQRIQSMVNGMMYGRGVFDICILPPIDSDEHIIHELLKARRLSTRTGGLSLGK